jgi:hypothetical protein
MNIEWDFYFNELDMDINFWRADFRVRIALFKFLR